MRWIQFIRAFVALFIPVVLILGMLQPVQDY